MSESTTHNPKGEEFQNPTFTENDFQPTVETTNPVDDLLNLVEQISNSRDLLNFANKVFDNAAIKPADKAKIITMTKARLGTVLNNITKEIATRAKLPGLNTRDVTQIDTTNDKMIGFYGLTQTEIDFIDGYDYTRNSLQNLSEDLSRMPIQETEVSSTSN